MTIQDWGALGELVGGVAVIITLLYLALQIRQNTHTVRLNTSHTVTEEYRGFFEFSASNRDLCQLVTQVGNNETLSGVDKTQYYLFLGNFFRAFENAYVQWRSGALNSGQWEGMRRMLIDNCQVGAVRHYWSDRRHWYSTDFQNFLETEILPKEQKQNVPLPGQHD